ncbi:unnamed protein product, partial [marine sediment metagenome]
EIVHKGVLIATSSVIVKMSFVHEFKGTSYDIYLPPKWLYFYPYKVYSVTGSVVPPDALQTTYIGLTFYN